MQGPYPVITLCGSTRFRDEFMAAQKKLTLEGNIVISVGLFGHSGDREVWEGMSEDTVTATKLMLDDMHKRRIADFSQGRLKSRLRQKKSLSRLAFSGIVLMLVSTYK